MPTKPWPATLKKKDSKPSTYRDLSIETQRIAHLKDHVYFVIYCWDMDNDAKTTSVLFRAHTSFDAPAERLGAIDSELVDLIADGDGLLVLENAIGREGYGIVHRLEEPFVKPKKSTSLRFKNANVYKSLARGDGGELYAAGDSIQRFDGKKWSQVPTPISYSTAIRAMATNGTTTVAVGRAGTIVELANGKLRNFVPGTSSGMDLVAVHVAADGTVSIAGNRGQALQGRWGKLRPLPGFDMETDVGGCASFQGLYYWTASGKASGVHVQRGGKLTNIFGDLNCFGLMATSDHLFVETEEGLMRFDGTAWKRIKTRYNSSKEIWAVTPTKAKK